MFTAVVVSMLSYACGDDAVGPEVPAVLLSTEVITDRTPRMAMQAKEVVAALQDPLVSDGTVLIGVKEASAVRGVGLDGRQLPVIARESAQRAIVGAFPELEVVAGVTRVLPFHSTSLGITVSDTSHTTWINARIPYRDEVIDRLLQHPNVDYVVPNFHNGVLLAELTPWGIPLMRADQAWSQGYTGGSIAVGIVDTGIDSDGYTPGSNNLHPDFVDEIIFRNPVHSRSDNACGSATGATSADPCYWEHTFHGTGVAGAFVARQNTLGSVGSAPGAGTYIMEVSKVGYTDTFGYFRLPQDAFAWAVLRAGEGGAWYDPKVRVAVTSVGYSSTNISAYQALHDAFATSYNQHDVLWFSAAGNRYGGFVVIPARFPEVIAVSSVESSGTRSAFSSVGPEVELAAPGGLQWLSWNRRDDFLGTLRKNVEGTSFAAPMAAGVGRLARQKYPNHTASQIRQMMQTYALDRGPVGKDDEYGFGQVDAVCLLNNISPCTP